MRKSIKLYAMLLAMPIIAMMTSYEPKALEEKDVFTTQDQLAQILESENPEGYDFYAINDFMDHFMTEEGNFKNDTCLYRKRSTADNTIYLFTIDTIPSAGRGVYIRGRIISDDFAGNYYKSLVIQQVVGGKQQTLRISVDLGSAGGMFPLGQEIVIRCNGLSIGRYANQPQLCVPSYNNNIYAMNANEKVAALKAGRKEFADMMDNVNRILRLVITGEVREDDVKSKCNGDCSECNGCG